MRPPPRRHFRESPHPAAHIEHKFAGKIFRAKPGTSPERSLRSLAAGIIQLGSRVKLPLKAKAPRIVLRVHKTKHAIEQWILSPALKAHQTARARGQSALAVKTTENR